MLYFHLSFVNWEGEQEKKHGDKREKCIFSSCCHSKILALLAPFYNNTSWICALQQLTTECALFSHSSPWAFTPSSKCCWKAGFLLEQRVEKNASIHHQQQTNPACPLLNELHLQGCGELGTNDRMLSTHYLLTGYSGISETAVKKTYWRTHRIYILLGRQCTWLVPALLRFTLSRADLHVGCVVPPSHRSTVLHNAIQAVKHTLSWPEVLPHA